MSRACDQFSSAIGAVVLIGPAGICHEGVDPAMVCRHVVDGGIDSGSICDVEDDAFGGTCPLATERRSRSMHCFEPVGQDHHGAELVEGLRDALADAARRPRDESDAPVQPKKIDCGHLVSHAAALTRILSCRPAGSSNASKPFLTTSAASICAETIFSTGKMPASIMDATRSQL